MRGTAVLSQNRGKKRQKTAQTAATDRPFHGVFRRSEMKTLERDSTVSATPTIR